MSPAVACFYCERRLAVPVINENGDIENDIEIQEQDEDVCGESPDGHHHETVLIDTLDGAHVPYPSTLTDITEEV